MFDFAEAIRRLKIGKNVARAGWNGRGMCIYVNKGSFDRRSEDYLLHPTHDYPTVQGVGLDLFDFGDEGTVTRMPNINMRAVGGVTVTGWLASQTDMLADDWIEV